MSFSFEEIITLSYQHISLLFCLPALFTLGNIKAKWPSVCRRGIDSANRVVQLFTGYKGPRFCVEVRVHAFTYSPTRPFSLFECCHTINYYFIINFIIYLLFLCIIFA